MKTANRVFVDSNVIRNPLFIGCSYLLNIQVRNFVRSMDEQSYFVVEVFVEDTGLRYQIRSKDVETNEQIILNCNGTELLEYINKINTNDISCVLRKVNTSTGNYSEINKLDLLTKSKLTKIHKDIFMLPVFSGEVNAHIKSIQAEINK